MVKSTTPVTLFLVLVVMVLGVTAEAIPGPAEPPPFSFPGPEEVQAPTRTLQRRSRANMHHQPEPRATQDPWARFTRFNWNNFIGWGWQGHDLQYVKDWYYDTYGLYLPWGVYSWEQLSFYVTYFGTPNPRPTPSISLYGPNTEDPWDYGYVATTAATSSSAVRTTSAASSSSSKASAAPSSSVASSTSSAGPTSSSSSKAASSSSSSAAITPAPSSSSSSSATTSSSSASSSGSVPKSSSSSAAASSSSSSSAAASSSSSSSASKAASSSSSSSASSSAISSSTSSSSAAATPTAPAVPSGWAVAPSACIADGRTGRGLLGSFTIDYNNTIASCLAKCDAGGYPLGGVEYGNQCFCGSYLSNGASLSNTATCNVACPGDSTGQTKCGGYYAMSLFVSTKINAAILSPDLTSVTEVLPSGWSIASKCMPEVNGRALTDVSYYSDGMTVPMCLNYCAARGYQYAGLQYGRECYCGNSVDNGASLLKVSASCGTPCVGNPTTSCGGYNALQVYNNPAYSYSNTIINGYVKTACLQEVVQRALRGAAYQDATGMTVDTCTQYCSDRGYGMAALEYGRECYCGSRLTGGASLLLTSGQCYMPCAGDPNQQCGGPNAMWLYINPNPMTAVITLPTGWTYRGCITEGNNGRALNFTATDFIAKGTMTGEQCARQCSALGYSMAGTEYSSQCYCGNGFTYGATGEIVDTLTDGTGQCNMPCPGNAAQMCGSANRLSIYSKLVSLPSVGIPSVARVSVKTGDKTSVV